MRRKEIGIVHVLNESEQIAAVQTQEGWFVVGSIPDARTDTLDDVSVLKRVRDLDEAEDWYNRRFGITTHGGARPGAGRKTIAADEPTKVTTVRLPQSHYDWLAAQGNVADTIRTLVRQAIETQIK